MPTHYDEGFFEGQRIGSRSSAEAILPPITEALKPTSVVDIGCGVGTWLAASRVEDVLGIDGPWVRREQLEIPADRFVESDLGEPITVARTFDLALCMETAEHLPAGRSAGLVADLVKLAPVVLFSAAVPGQQGTDHINEQWADFWSDLFAAHGYRRIDAIRWQHWDDPRVEPWYAQNAYLYVAGGVAVDLPAPEGVHMRIVHPGFLAFKPKPTDVSGEFALAAFKWHLRLKLRSLARHS